MKHNGLMVGAAVAALMATGDPAYAGSLPAQVDAAREAAFAEADADGDGSLDADERAVFHDLFRTRLEELNPDVIEEGGGGDVYRFHQAVPAPEGGAGQGLQEFEIHLRNDGDGAPPERGFRHIEPDGAVE